MRKQYGRFSISIENVLSNKKTINDNDIFIAYKMYLIVQSIL